MSGGGLGGSVRRARKQEGEGGNKWRAFFEHCGDQFYWISGHSFHSGVVGQGPFMHGTIYTSHVHKLHFDAKVELLNSGISCFQITADSPQKGTKIITFYNFVHLLHRNFCQAFLFLLVTGMYMQPRRNLNLPSYPSLIGLD